MNTAGIITMGQEKYYLFLNDIKGSETYILVSPYHEDLLFNNDNSKKVLNSIIEVRENFGDGYVTEIMTRLKVSGKVKYYKGYRLIENILSTISFARNYSFRKEDIIANDLYNFQGEIRKDFVAQDDNLSYSIETVNNLVTRLEIKYGAIELALDKIPFQVPFKQFEFIELKSLEKKNILIASLKVITLQTLQESLDMSWYFKDGVKQKKYSSVTTIEEFENNVITPIVREMQRCHEREEPLYISLDTETTGFNLYNLSKDNESLDHCVAVIVSWEEDQGVVIFTDMEHFDSIPNEYVWKRLAILFEKFNGERTIELYGNAKTPLVNVSNYDLDSMNFFDDFDDVDFEGTSSVSINNSDSNRVVIDTVTFERSWLNLIGHNVMFDKRVGISVGFYLWFDDDTLQMSFDLNPLTVRGFNKLKGLTRRIFNHETPELSDILGKGNEDKYRYLADREVAEIYGCADGDYTRKVFMYLRKLMSERMYRTYKMQDVPMLNILPRSEYYGLQTFEKDVIKLAEDSYNNLEILKHFIYEYVGSFIDYYQQRNIIESRNKAGYYASQDEYRKALASIQYHEGKYYEFDFKPSEIRNVLYNILKYKIYGYTEGAKKLPKTDKFVMKKLMAQKRDKDDVNFKRMNKDLLVAGADPIKYQVLKQSGENGNKKDKKAAEKMVLISADKFNKLKYPLALALSEYATRNKEYTSYYKPIREENLEGKIFKSYNLARIETRRISNPAQTMKGNLKALIKAYSDDYYLLDFDMSQVEYRIMLSLARHMAMVERMKDPERDYHTETASLINNIPAHKVDKKTRKSAKSVSFGVPYGLGEMTLCSNLFGEVTKDNLFATRLILAKWEDSNHPIVTFLNETRDNALVATSMSDELRDFIGAWKKDELGEYVLDDTGHKIPVPIGKVENQFGFYRTFDLSAVDFSEEAVARRKSGKFVKEEATVRRAAGNYPIQAFAAELFRIILIRFYNRCEEEGINDKLIWHMLIHDELLTSVHKSLHPYYIYKLVKEACMVTMKGHTSYFIGINIGNTWAETKDDAREAPVYFVDRMVKKWDNGDFGTGPFWFDNPWEELIKGDRARYVFDRIGEVLIQVQPNIKNEPINIPWIMEHFSNYTVRAYINDYSMNIPVNENDFDLKDPSEVSEYEDRIWASRFETWALEYFGENKEIIDYDGNLRRLIKGVISEPVALSELDVDYAELFDDSVNADEGYWTFDEQEASDIYESDYVIFADDYEEEEFSYDLDFSTKNATNVAQLFKRTTEYKHIKVLNEQVVIKLDNNHQVSLVKKFLENNVTKVGNTVCFQTILGGVERWLKIKSKTDLNKVDKYIDSLMESHSTLVNYSSFNLVNKNLIISYTTTFELNKIKDSLASLVSKSGEYTIIFKNPLNNVERWMKVSHNHLEALNETLEKIRR